MDEGEEREQQPPSQPCSVISASRESNMAGVKTSFTATSSSPGAWAVNRCDRVERYESAARTGDADACICEQTQTERGVQTERVACTHLDESLYVLHELRVVRVLMCQPVFERVVVDRREVPVHSHRVSEWRSPVR